MGTGDRLAGGAFGALVSEEGEERVHSASSLDVGEPSKGEVGRALP